MNNGYDKLKNDVTDLMSEVDRFRMGKRKVETLVFPSNSEPYIVNLTIVAKSEVTFVLDIAGGVPCAVFDNKVKIYQGDNAFCLWKIAVNGTHDLEIQCFRNQGLKLEISGARWDITG